ncbi:MAG: alanine--tRNA ligase, partial [Anaerolineales bacterium]|nr:alanine--tRNA ligase [Anaerolineales bacterium]
MKKTYTGNQIRQMYIDFFEEHAHTFVPSSSLVPGGDSTLLFTNAGMVQFKDVFLGTDDRPYTRAVNSQKCMRVAGKHNDLEDVGRDDTHHTFFEMLGNWSFGDYYKKEAIAWGWQLLTEVWGLPKERLYASVFKDEKDEIPTDEEAAQYWLAQPGFDPSHLVYLGRKDNFWEMADTGPCGPNSEVHYDLGPEYGEFEYMEDGQIDLDGSRFVEVWNLVFIQFNRIDENTLEPLPKTHVDTGMGFDRIVSILQGKSSNYRTDLLWPVVLTIQSLAGQSDEEREANFTPYRVITDHARAAAFLIADGVVPGNLGRNYVTRMIIRRAARFGTKLGLNQPFLAKVAATVIDIYGDAYPELVQHRATILDNLTREEERFQRTVESGIGHLEDLLKEMTARGGKVLGGAAAFDLYQTYGLPLEITRDILQERGLDVDDEGFRQAMEEHRIASGAGHAMGEMGINVEFYRTVSQSLQADGKLPASGVVYDPYHSLEVEGDVLALMSNGKSVSSVQAGDPVEVVLPETCFYVASGGQVADHGTIVSVVEPRWEIRVDDTFQPAAGLIVHVGEVVKGAPKAGDTALAAVDRQRRQDIMRNHTATHLLHSALHRILGEHARQAGSLVAPDRLRFDFTHPEALTAEELAAIEEDVNYHILDNYMLNIEHKSLEQAKQEGAMALFGEKYAETVRTIQIGDGEPFSYELCGGTHVDRTG